MKRKSTKVPWASLTRKNATPYFKEHCTKIDISLVVIRFFFCQTNLVFLTHYLLRFWRVFATVYLHLYLVIFTFILRILKFIQCPYAFFIKASKVLIRFNVLFVSLSCLIIREKILPVNIGLLLTALNGWFPTLITRIFATCNHQFSEFDWWGFLPTSSPNRSECTILDGPFWQVYQYLKLFSLPVLHFTTNVLLDLLAWQQQCCFITCDAWLKYCL